MRDLNAVPLAHVAKADPADWRTGLRVGTFILLPNRIETQFLDLNLEQFVRDGGARERRLSGNTTDAQDLTAIKGKRVLVLEDRIVNQTIVQRQLRKLGVSCSIAADGVEGLEKHATEKFDLILCDCSMPVMNGFEFTRILREKERDSGGRIPVIAMTANAFREDMEKCFAAGMDDFLSKPVTLQRLASVLARWMGGGERQSKASNGTNQVSPTGKAVNVDILAELLGTDDRDLIASILGEFVEAARLSWTQTQEARDNGMAALASAAHGAKGEARNAGAAILGDLYAALESAAKSDDDREAGRIMKAIPEELERVEGFVGDYQQVSAA
ncbi:MAG: response regulator [Rhodobacteraceae bacterium]|nr:response regulator [Paracoccaceae bacterium]